MVIAEAMSLCDPYLELELYLEQAKVSYKKKQLFVCIALRYDCLFANLEFLIVSSKIKNKI